MSTPEVPDRSVRAALNRVLLGFLEGLELAFKDEAVLVIWTILIVSCIAKAAVLVRGEPLPQSVDIALAAYDVGALVVAIFLRFRKAGGPL